MSIAVSKKFKNFPSKDSAGGKAEDNTNLLKPKVLYSCPDVIFLSGL